MSRKINIVRERTTNHPTVIHMLYCKNKDTNKSDYPWAERFILGFPVPDFQRELVWTESQKISFIESIWYHYDIGTFMITDYQTDNDGIYVKYSDCLIDGQQRLKAIEDYWNDEFKVLGYKWSELDFTDRRSFNNIGFGHHMVYTLDETKLRETYDRLNFGGVAHKESERATKL